jgi:hypothetical protein
VLVIGRRPELLNFELGFEKSLTIYNTDCDSDPVPFFAGLAADEWLYPAEQGFPAQIGKNGTE